MKNDIGWKDNNDGQGEAYWKATGGKPGKPGWSYNYSTKYLYQPDGQPVLVIGSERYAVFSSLMEARWWVRNEGPEQWRNVVVEEVDQANA